MNGERNRGRAVFVAVLCMASLTGCGLFRGAARHAEDVPVPPPHVEVPAPPVGGAPVEEAAAVTARKAEILAPVDDLNAEERRQVIEAACRLRSLYDLSQVEDENELVYEAAVELGGDTTKGARAVRLAFDIYYADDPMDVVDKGAVAAICGP